MNLSKTIYVFFLGAFAVSFWTSCSKENSPSPSAVASLNVVNALPTSSPLILVQGPIVQEIGHFYGIGALSYGATAVLTSQERIRNVVCPAKR